MRIYELEPITSQKSFYGKAIVEVDDNGDETLYSYNTPIIKKWWMVLIKSYGTAGLPQQANI